MIKVLTVVVLRASILGTNVSFVDSRIVKDDNLEEMEWELNNSAECHIREFKEKFPEFKEAEFKISIHSGYASN